MFQERGCHRGGTRSIPNAFIRPYLLFFKVLHNLKSISILRYCCVPLPKNKYTAMKKGKTNDDADKRKMSKLEKENARLKAQNEQLKSDNKRLRSDLGKASKKKTPGP